MLAGEMDDLDEAISVAQHAVDEMPEDHPQFLIGLTTLSHRLRDKFARTGAAHDLEKAIAASSQALEAMPDDHQDRSEQFGELSNLLASRYSSTGATEDLERAIQMRLGNLAVQLQQRFLRTKAAPDLEESSELSKRAMEMLPDDYPDQSRHRHDLGIKLARKFTITNNMADLEAGIQCIRLALERMPHDHANRAVYLHSLANGLIQKGSETFEPTDVDEWIAVTKEALSLTPENHTDRELLYSLGVGHLAACAVNKTGDGVEEAIVCFNSALRQPNAPTLCHIRACMSLLSINPDWKESLEAAKLVMALLPRLTPRSLDNEDRQNSLSEIAGLASDAAAVAIQCEDVAAALDLLEQA
ncbi:hypothetical protein AUP68_17011 [Ilyonectria robusta]